MALGLELLEMAMMERSSASVSMTSISFQLTAPVVDRPSSSDRLVKNSTPARPSGVLMVEVQVPSASCAATSPPPPQIHGSTEYWAWPGTGKPIMSSSASARSSAVSRSSSQLAGTSWPCSSKRSCR